MEVAMEHNRVNHLASHHLEDSVEDQEAVKEVIMEEEDRASQNQEERLQNWELDPTLMLSTLENKMRIWNVYCIESFDTTRDSALFSEINFLFSDFNFGVSYK